VGEETAELLTKEFKNFNELMKASVEDFEKIHGIGGVVAESICNWFASEENTHMLLGLLEHIKIKKENLASSRFQGKSFVFTGGLETMSRDEAKKIVKENAGQIMSSVSKKTDYVVAGSDSGTKLEQAHTLGVKVLTESEFLQMIK
jgi:DNA ligase (NAD+)